MSISCHCLFSNVGNVASRSERSIIKRPLLTQWIKTISPAFSKVIIASASQSCSVSILQLKIEVPTILKK